MTKIAARRRLVCGLALTLSLAIASCGGNVRDDLGDSDPESGGARPIGASGASSGGGSKATGTGGKTGGSGAVGAGAVPGAAGKSGGAGAGIGGGKSGGAGAVGIGGKGGGAGTIGGGTGGGKAGGAGVPAAGGVPVDPCSRVLCEPLMCPAGTFPYYAPGACCGSCVPKCALVDCAVPKCQPNEILTTPPGECCPRCEPIQDPDAGALCNQTGYTSLRDALEQKYGSTQCSSDTECRVGALNLCGKPDCGVALPAAYYSSFVENLTSYARANCLGCGPITIVCPPTTPVAKCLGGYCSVVRQ